jgi:hypothetical protein
MMPLVGTGDVDVLADGQSTITALDTPALSAPGAQLLHIMCEIERAGATRALPPALHPQNMPTLSMYVLRCPETEIGPITLAQVGIASRSGTWPCNYLLRTVVHEQAAADALAARVGDRCTVGDVNLLVRSDRVTGSAAIDGETILEIGCHLPTPISAGDVAYYSNINLAETPRGTELAYYERRMDVKKADRGAPMITTFDAAAWGSDLVRLTYPVSASLVHADVTIGPLLMVSNPSVARMAEFEMLNV